MFQAPEKGFILLGVAAQRFEQCCWLTFDTLLAFSSLCAQAIVKAFPEIEESSVFTLYA